MLEKIINILPSMILVIAGMPFLLTATGLKYSLKKTLYILIPSLAIIIYVNSRFLSSTIVLHDNWSILSVFLPEFLLAYFLGKKRGTSGIVAILSAYVIFYIAVLLKNTITIYFKSIIFEYLIYLLFLPLLFGFLINFYNKFHREVETLIPNCLKILGIYSGIIFVEFYAYRYLIQTTNTHVLRLEIFGVAIISIYILSIMFFNIILTQYKKTFIKANEKEMVDHQLESLVEQFKIRDEKENELKILRHDIKHVLITASSLIQQKKYTEANKVLEEQIQIIDTNRITRYCNDPIINAVIGYYKNLCIQNKISLKIKVKNIESALKIRSSELAILLSNCFDNAINATNKLKRNRLIEFKFINTDGNLILQFKNNYEGNIQFDKNKMPTNLKENHGIGTQSIISFCKKYNLTLDYEITDDVFIVSIIF